MARQKHGVLNAVSHHHNHGVNWPRPFARMNGLTGRIICGAMLIAAPMLVPGATLAQATDWPAKPVTVVVGYAAGGNTDVMARMASKKLTEDLKQSFIVENSIRAGGALAAAYVAQAAPDGYTLFLRARRAANRHRAAAAKGQLRSEEGLYPGQRLRHRALHPRHQLLDSGQDDCRIRGLCENPQDQLRIERRGSVAHLAAALFVNRAGLDAVHVPFRGSGQVTAALLGGQIDMFFGNASDLVPQVESGKVTLLGVATPRRMKQLPNVPTIGETYPSTSLESWNGFLVPAKTPPEIIDKLAKHVIAAAKDPATVAQLNALGIEANGTTPEEFAAQINREQPQFDDAIKAAKLQPE